MWLPVIVLFVLQLWSSFISLKHLGVAMVTVLKNLTNLLTICGEYLVFGRTYGVGVWSCLALMTLSAVSGAATDLSFSFTGYTWQILNCVSAAWAVREAHSACAPRASAHTTPAATAARATRAGTPPRPPSSRQVRRVALHVNATQVRRCVAQVRPGLPGEGGRGAGTGGGDGAAAATGARAGGLCLHVKRTYVYSRRARARLWGAPCAPRPARKPGHAHARYASGMSSGLGTTAMPMLLHEPAIALQMFSSDCNSSLGLSLRLICAMW